MRKVIPIHEVSSTLPPKCIITEQFVCLLHAVRFSDIFFLFKHLVTHFEATYFISDQQHGSRHGFSTVTQLFHAVNEFVKLSTKAARWTLSFYISQMPSFEYHIKNCGRNLKFY